jgi:hypothetical protein
MNSSITKSFRDRLKNLPPEIQRLAGKNFSRRHRGAILRSSTERTNRRQFTVDRLPDLLMQNASSLTGFVNLASRQSRNPHFAVLAGFARIKISRDSEREKL